MQFCKCDMLNEILYIIEDLPTVDNEVSHAGLLSLKDEAHFSWLEIEMHFPAPNKRESLLAFCPQAERIEPGRRFRGFQRRVSPYLITHARGRSFSDRIRPWHKLWPQSERLALPCPQLAVVSGIHRTQINPVDCWTIFTLHLAQEQLFENELHSKESQARPFCWRPRFWL